MKIYLRIVICLVFGAMFGSSIAAERGTAEEAIAMVHAVIASMKKTGKEKTLDDINKGKYIDRDLYISVTDGAGKSVANSVNPRIVGKNVSDLRDADGKFFVREGSEIVKAKGKGWIDFKWPDPVSKKIEAKSTYLEQFDDLVVGCGIYKMK